MWLRDAPAESPPWPPPPLAIAVAVALAATRAGGLDRAGGRAAALAVELDEDDRALHLEVEDGVGVRGADPFKVGVVQMLFDFGQLRLGVPFGHVADEHLGQREQLGLLRRVQGGGLDQPRSAELAALMAPTRVRVTSRKVTLCDDDDVM